MSDPKFENIGDPDDKLVEECGEVLRALSKAKRFGYFNHHPARPKNTNIDELRYELDYLINAANNLQDHLGLIQRFRDGWLIRA